MSRRTNSATSRLRQDYMRLKKEAVPYIVAEPLPSNLLEWHYVVEGPESRCITCTLEPACKVHDLSNGL